MSLSRETLSRLRALEAKACDCFDNWACPDCRELTSALPELLKAAEELDQTRADLNHEYAVRCECVFLVAGVGEETETLRQHGDDSGPMECDFHAKLRKERDSLKERVARLEEEVCRFRDQ